MSDLPAWLGAVGTIGAFVIALVLLRATVMDRRTAQARLVSAWSSRNTMRHRQGTKAHYPPVRVVPLDGTLAPDVIGAGGGALTAERDYWLIPWFLVNASDEMVSEVECYVQSSDGEQAEFVALLLALPGRHRYEGMLQLQDERWEGHRMHAVRIDVHFTDATGRRWERTTGQALKRRKFPDRRLIGTTEEHTARTSTYRLTALSRRRTVGRRPAGDPSS